ncbi:MAG TPA: hypothetical protein VLB83_02175 [Candidatus Paceibacterota bacterium]|nr:hypothetical protein [Candidatus Paceibacterota bacterium]
MMYSPEGSFHEDNQENVEGSSFEGTDSEGIEYAAEDVGDTEPSAEFKDGIRVLIDIDELTPQELQELAQHRVGNGEKVEIVNE